MTTFYSALISQKNVDVSCGNITLCCTISLRKCTGKVEVKLYSSSVSVSCLRSVNKQDYICSLKKKRYLFSLNITYSKNEML